MDLLISAGKSELIIINKKYENLQNYALCCTGWPQNKMTESEKMHEYLDLARELKNKLWNMKVTIIPIVIGAFSTVTKVL